MSAVVASTCHMILPEYVRELATHLDENPDLSVVEALNQFVEFGAWEGDWRRAWQVLEDIVGAEGVAEIMAAEMAETGSYTDISGQRIGTAHIPSVLLDGEPFPARDAAEKALDEFATAASEIACAEFDFYEGAKELVRQARDALDDPDFPVWEVGASSVGRLFGDTTLRNLLIACRMRAAMDYDMRIAEIAERLIREELAPADLALPVLLRNDQMLFRRIACKAMDAVLERESPGHGLG